MIIYNKSYIRPKNNSHMCHNLHNFIKSPNLTKYIHSKIMTKKKHILKLIIIYKIKIFFKKNLNSHLHNFLINKILVIDIIIIYFHLNSHGLILNKI